MDFLALCKRTASKCAVSQTGPTDTTSQSGRLLQVVNWVQEAWGDVQTKRNDWLFMRSSFSVDTMVGTNRYAATSCTDSATSLAIAHFRDWIGRGREDVRIKVYLLASGIGSQGYLTYLEYRDWMALYGIGSPSNSMPRHWTRAPNGDLLVGPAPDAVYRVTGDFMHCASELSGDDATPALPEEYHMAIVYRAMMKYGAFIGANEVYVDGQAEYNRMLREIIRTQAPAPRTAPPLA